VVRAGLGCRELTSIRCSSSAVSCACSSLHACRKCRSVSSSTHCLTRAPRASSAVDLAYAELLAVASPSPSDPVPAVGEPSSQPTLGFFVSDCQRRMWPLGESLAAAGRSGVRCRRTERSPTHAACSPRSSTVYLLRPPCWPTRALACGPRACGVRAGRAASQTLRGRRGRVTRRSSGCAHRSLSRGREVAVRRRRRSGPTARGTPSPH
jgi:hypothetical protein